MTTIILIIIIVGLLLGVIGLIMTNSNLRKENSLLIEKTKEIVIENHNLSLNAIKNNAIFSKIINLTETMPDGFEKLSPKRRTQVATMKFQDEIHKLKAIKYDFANGKLILKIYIDNESK
ncbi:MAG: hypothetical protein LBP67_05150 [Bacteroidales bacterium]|jgi:hypothetical protein|nr:hypothetical protein [Bacteroidales bacterium]